MAVVFDAISSPADQTANAVVGTTGFTTSGGLITVGSGSNRALVVCINFSLPTVSSVAVTWDTGGTNQAMTQIVGAALTSVGDAQLWGLVNPTSGNKNLKVTWIGTSDIIVGAVSWTGVDQTGGATSFPNSLSDSGAANSTTGTIDITSATGNATVATITTSNGAISAPTQTSIYIDTSPASENGAASRAAGAATVTHQWTIGFPNTGWIDVGTDIQASASGAPAITADLPVYAQPYHDTVFILPSGFTPGKA